MRTTDEVLPAPPDDRHLARTESVCPDCLRRLPASHVARGDEVHLVRDCPEHGLTDAVVWRGEPGFATWTQPVSDAAAPPLTTDVRLGCPFDCGLCPAHRQASCCVLLEVTARCDLRCPVCFASAGGASVDPGREVLIDRMRRLYDAAGPVNLQLSGGEPCVRDDLPELVAAARGIGFDFVQVNSNGCRLATDRTFAARLGAAGASTVFLQFDGTRDVAYRAIRGRPLLARKLEAIAACGEAGLGVVLVPVVVPGLNDDDLWSIVELAIRHQPTVRGVHFQPVSYFGRYPTAPSDASRITLPEILTGLEAQSAGRLRANHFQPAGSEHARCSFNGRFVTMPDGRLVALTRRPADGCCGLPDPARASRITPSERVRAFVAGAWTAPGEPQVRSSDGSLGEWDVFLERTRTHQLTISAMAFQDAWTLDLERLRRCHVHVATLDGRTIPFCAYNLTDSQGSALYRGRR